MCVDARREIIDWPAFVSPLTVLTQHADDEKAKGSGWFASYTFILIYLFLVNLPVIQENRYLKWVKWFGSMITNSIKPSTAHCSCIGTDGAPRGLWQPTHPFIPYRVFWRTAMRRPSDKPSLTMMNSNEHQVREGQNMARNAPLALLEMS